MNKKNDKNVAIKESIEIVKKFNKENRYRDCGRVNNAIDALIFVAENSIPVQKVKDKIEEIKEDYEDSKDENGESEYYYPDYTIRKLEELLEDK